MQLGQAVSGSYAERHGSHDKACFKQGKRQSWAHRKFTTEELCMLACSDQAVNSRRLPSYEVVVLPAVSVVDPCAMSLETKEDMWRVLQRQESRTGYAKSGICKVHKLLQCHLLVQQTTTPEKQSKVCNTTPHMIEALRAEAPVTANGMRSENWRFMMRRAAQGLGAARYSSRACSSCPCCSQVSPTDSISSRLSLLLGTKLLRAPASTHDFKAGIACLSLNSFSLLLVGG